MTITADAKWRFPFPVFFISSLISLCSFFFPLPFRFSFSPVWSIRIGLSMSRSPLNFDQPCEYQWLDDWIWMSDGGRGAMIYDFPWLFCHTNPRSLLLFSVSALLSCSLSLSSSLWSSSLIELLMLRIARLDALFPPSNWLYHSAQAEWWTQCVFSTSYRLNCSLHWQMITVFSTP